MHWKIFEIVTVILVFSIYVLFGYTLHTNTKTRDNKLRIGLEMAYFEGQKDALENDIRIKQNDKGCWEWSKSPWDEGNRMPTYNPKNCEYYELP